MQKAFKIAKGSSSSLSLFSAGIPQGANMPNAKLQGKKIEPLANENSKLLRKVIYG